jgi:hypothetical protein
MSREHKKQTRGWKERDVCVKRAENGSVHIEPTDSWRQRCLSSAAPLYVKSGVISWRLGSQGITAAPIRLRTRTPSQNFGAQRVKKERSLGITATFVGYFAKLPVPGMYATWRTWDGWQIAKDPFGTAESKKARRSRVRQTWRRYMKTLNFLKNRNL